jgi:hypothetical protein
MANELKRPLRRGLTVVTTDNTVTTIATLTPFTDRVTAIKAKIYAIRDTAAEVAYYERVALFKNDAGTLTLVGSVATPVTIESAAGWDATIAADGTAIEVNVTGANDSNIRWKCDVESYGMDYSGQMDA